MEIRRKVYAGEHFTSFQRKRWRQRLYERSIKKRKETRSINFERLKTEMEEIMKEQRNIAEGMKQVADKFKELDAELEKVMAESLILIKEAAAAKAAELLLLNRRMNEVMDEQKRGINDFRTLFEMENYLLLELPG